MLYSNSLSRFAENFNLQHLNYFPISISRATATVLEPRNESREVPSYEFIAVRSHASYSKCLHSLVYGYFEYHSRFRRDDSVPRKCLLETARENIRL